MANKYGLNFGEANLVDYKAGKGNGFQANENMIDPKFLADNSTNFFLNNKNLQDVMSQKIISDIFLETLKSENDNIYISNASRHFSMEARAGSNRYQVQRWRTMSITTQPMREGHVPAPLTTSLEAVSVTTAAYGDWIQITDIMAENAPVDVWAELTTQLAHSMGLKLNLIVREIMYLGATHYFVGDKTTAEEAGAKGTRAITVDDLTMIIRQMKEDKVKPHTSGRYVVIGGQDLFLELHKDPNIKEYALAQSMQPVTESPWKAKLIYGELMIVEAAEPKKVAGKDGDTEVAFVLGQDAYVTVGINGMEGIKMIHKDFGSAGTNDPFNQLASLSAQIKSFGAAVLNPNAIAAIHFPSVMNAVGAEASGAAGKALYNSSFTDMTEHDMQKLLGSDEQDLTAIWDGAVYPRPIESHKAFILKNEADSAEVFIKEPVFDGLKESEGGEEEGEK